MATRPLYDFTNKQGITKSRFLQNEWSKKYRRIYSSYRQYRAAMEPKVTLNEETKLFEFKF